MEEKINLPIREKMQVRVFQRIVEGKRERLVPFVGIVQKVRGAGVNKTITVKQILEGVEVEKIFPLALPTIIKVEVIEVVKKKKPTRGKSSSTPKKSTPKKSSKVKAKKK